jgi:integrase
MTTGNQLTAKFVEAVKSQETRKKYDDGNGLKLVVQPAGSKNWILRHTVNGRRVEKGLGGYPAVSLAQARIYAEKERRGEVWSSSTALMPVAPVPDPVLRSPYKPVTFEAAAREFYAMHKGIWKGRQAALNWIGRMVKYAFPLIGSKLCSDVGSPDMLAVLRPIWREKISTADKLRVNLAQVMKAAKAAGYCGADNASAVDDALQGLPKGKRDGKGHPAMRLEDVPDFFRSLYGMSECDVLLRCALAFTVLTGKRSGEVRLAKWSEFKDLDKRLWNIPGERMKMGRAHREPLSVHALNILEIARRCNDDSEYVFPNRETGQPFSDMAMLQIMRRSGYMDADGKPVTVHGFRATFRTWAAEETNYPPAICELALAHGNPDKIEAAYQRSDLEAKRRAMMEDWAKAAVGFAHAGRLLLAA